MPDVYLAIDIGASSGRHILGRKEGGKLVLEEVWRFDNRQVQSGGHDCWDLACLWQGVLDGMKRCAARRPLPVSVGIDTWAVDFVLLNDHESLIGDAVAYRDARTEGMDRLVEARVSPQELYARTGIQKQPFNTIYQLMALMQEHPDHLARARSLLMMPDYLNFLLTGRMCQEYTNATSTNLVSAETGQWDMELIAKLGLPAHLFTPLSMPGARVGNLRRELTRYVGFDTTVVLPATHDTGSAFLAVPARDEHAVYLSSGTWSLLGVENDRPITSEASRAQNFTNEGGAWHRFRYLKNIMGLWMIQSIRRELNGEQYVAGKVSRHAAGRTYSFPELIEEAKKAEGFPSVVDANDAAFLAPESMIDAIRDACARTNQTVPQSVGEIMQCVYQSLARCYKDAIDGLSALTGKTYTSINIVGGGCQDHYLNQLTARETGLPVFAGPVEGTAIGNLLVQMIAAGEFASLEEARAAVRASFDIQEFAP